MFSPLHWLEKAEYILLFTTVLCSLIAIASTNFLYLVIPLCFSLVLNLINRSRFQRHYRGKINSEIKEIKDNLSQEIETIKKSYSQSHSQTVNPSVTAPLQEKLEVLETNIRSIQQYLNNNYFLERIIKLEGDLPPLNQLQILTEKYQQLEVKIKHIQLTESRSEKLTAFPAETEEIQKNILKRESESLLISEKINKLEEDLEQLKPLKILIEKYQQLETEIKYIQSTQSLLENATPLSGETEEIRKNIIKRESELLLILERINKLEEAYAQLNQVENLAEKYYQLQGSINLLEETYSSSPTNLPDPQEETKLKIRTMEAELFSLAEKVKLLENPTNKIDNTTSATFSQPQTITEIKSELTPAKITPVELEKPLNLPTISWQHLKTLKGHAQAVTALAFSADGKYIASVSWDKKLKLWLAENGKKIDSISAHDQGLLAVSFTSNWEKNNDSYDYYLATGSFDQNIKIWYLEPKARGELIFKLDDTIREHTGSIQALAFAPKHKILVSGSYDQTVKQWEMERGKLLESYDDEQGGIYAIALHEPQELIASAGADGRITFWQLGKGKKLTQLLGNVSSVKSLAIHPTGNILAAGCVDGTVKLWYLEPDIFTSSKTSRPSYIISAHAGHVNSLIFSGDGAILYTCGTDDRIKMWDTESAQQIGNLQLTNDNRILSLALSPDGNLLVAGSSDGAINMWLRQ